MLQADSIRRWLIRPALALWAVLAAVLIAATAGQMLLPPEIWDLDRFLPHRDNLNSPEWRAALEAEKSCMSGRPVLVDTDNSIFLFILRYRCYPTWVIPSDGRLASEVSPGEAAVTRVSYREGVLRPAGEDL
jgi:hypothetical protein